MTKPRLAALALLACIGCRKPPAPAPDVVAESRSGPVRFEEVERALDSPARAADRTGGRSRHQATDQVALYRRAAEELVVERAILAEVGDLDAALEGLGAEHERLRREAILELFNLEQDRAQAIRVDPEEVRSYYDSHEDEFHRPAVRVVWHLFRRDEDPAKPAATVAFLASLKKRAEGGEAFSLLAREYSQSETRLLDGRLGTLGRGRLPKALDEVVFALPKGGISDPIRVKGGAVLFHVSHLVEEKQFPFEDVRVIIARRLGDRKRQERISEALEGAPPPEGAILLDDEALRRLVESGDPAEVVLQVGARKLTLKEFRELLDRERTEEAESLPRPPLPERLSDIYRRLEGEALLVAKLEAEGFDKAPHREAPLRERVRRQGLKLVVAKRIEERIWKLVDADADSLKRFHQENRFLYQSPLRLKIWTLSVSGPDLARKASELATLRQALEKGQIDLQAAAAQIGGRVDDGGWLEPAAIAAMEPKVRSYLLEMNGPGYSVPFQLNRRLSVIRVEKRDEPRALPYEEVKDRVRQDYHERRQQELYREVVSGLLRDQLFRFDEDAVKRALAAPAPKAAPAASPA
jgi:parvulin-like peptidyl-prolyl isomerase